MERSSWRPSPGTVLGVLALVVAVAGTAVADPLVKISVLSKKEKKQTRKIARGQVKKLAPGLSVGRATDADKLDGKDSTAFADAGEVHTPARLVLNDQNPGDVTPATATLLTAGSFSVGVQCYDNFNAAASEIANLHVLGPMNSSFAGQRTGGVESTEPAGLLEPLALTSSSGNEIGAGQLTAVAPNGQVLSVSGSAEVNDPAGDCVFAVTAHGP